MLPAVSALDCLIADLGIDPGEGLQAYEATEFLLYGRRPDPTAPLVLWQLSVVGADRWSPAPDVSRLGVLVAALVDVYGDDHEVVLYEASPYPVAGPRIERRPLGRLGEAEITPMASLLVPPLASPEARPDVARLLGFEP